MDSCIEYLKKVECPMNWDLTVVRSQSAKIDCIVGRLKERLEENSHGETWKTLGILLFLSYEHYMAQKGTFNFIFYLRHSEEIIEKDSWLQKYQSAAQHVLYSIWAYIFLKTNLPRSTYYHKKIKPFEEMTDEEKAFVLAFKASFFMMYGPPGNSDALKIFAKVLLLDQNVPEWWFLTGKCLARMRRLHYRSTPTAQEISMFKKAVEMKENCVRYLIHLARSKADLASYLIHNKTSVDDFKVIEALNTDVESLLRKAVTMRVNSCHLICHIAKSFMKLPHYFRVRNRHLTQFCVLQAIRMSPTDPMVNHTAGLYCLMQDDLENAVYYLTEASNMGVYGASFDLCRLKWKECRKYNPVPDLNEIIEQNDEYAASEANCLLATYYFFAKNDLMSTIEHWKKWHHRSYKESYPITSVFLGQESFDFNSVLYDEVRLELDSTRYDDPKDKLLLEEVIKIIDENRPELKDEKPRRQRQHLIDKAQMISKIGRAYPDSLSFLAKEQRQKKKGKTYGKEEIAKNGKSRMDVPLKYNGYKIKKEDRKKTGLKKEGRSQSTSRAQEYDKKYREKPFWRPPRRHRSLVCLKTAASETGDKNNDISGKDKKTVDTQLSANKKKNVGSGRVICDEPKSNLLKVKATSMEMILLAKSYERKKGYSRQNSYERSTPNNWHSASQESLSSNFSGRSEYSEKRAFINTRQPERERSEEVKNPSRQPSSQRDNSLQSTSQEIDVRPSRQPSIGIDVGQVRTESSGSGVESSRSWRQDRHASEEHASPRSSFFQSWSNRSQEDGRPSRTGLVGESPSSQWNKDQSSTARPRSSFREFGGPSASFPSRNKWNQGDNKGLSSRNEEDNSRPWSRSSFQGHADPPTSAFFQSRSQGDRVRSSSRTSSVGEETPTSSYFQWNNSLRTESSRTPLRSFPARQEDFQPRFEIRDGYTPRGGSFNRGGQRDPRRQNMPSRESGGALPDLFRRLDLGRKW